MGRPRLSLPDKALCDHVSNNFGQTNGHSFYRILYLIFRSILFSCKKIYNVWDSNNAQKPRENG